MADSNAAWASCLYCHLRPGTRLGYCPECILGVPIRVTYLKRGGESSVLSQTQENTPRFNQTPLFGGSYWQHLRHLMESGWVVVDATIQAPKE